MPQAGIAYPTQNHVFCHVPLRFVLTASIRWAGVTDEAPLYRLGGSLASNGDEGGTLHIYDNSGDFL
ncbi:hypothetical protein [Vacuolonema iberomarrocanum]|uniref:hypothetical protein n=1 Tax=Vacuolonema iberomarrocanum TaxID=3454632 RepID=UPI001A0972D9|nr:hypothetical protein [filamentous cyanobacterium LEGE 07170]